MKNKWCFLLLVVGLLLSFSTIKAQDLLVEKFKLFEEREDVVVKDFIVDQENFIWFLANNKLYRFDGSNSEEISLVFDNFDINVPNSILLSLSNKIWITGINKIGFIDLEQWTYTALDLSGVNLQSAFNYTVYETSDGTIVFAYNNGKLLFVSNGVIYYDDTVFQKSQQDKVRIGITSLAEFKNKLWVSTTSGHLLEINLYNHSIDQIIQATNNQSIIPYYPKTKDDNSKNNHGALGFDAKNNKLNAGELEGYTTIDLNGTIGDVKFLSYVLSEVITSGKNSDINTIYNISYNNLKEILIPKNSPYVRIKFKQNELDVNTMKYEYLIPELSEDWRKLDISKSIELVGINPGSYHLKVRHPGDKSSTDFIIKKDHYFYQTWWFYFFIVMTLIGLGLVYFRFRVNLIRKNKRLRSRIAADLHDDIGSVLGGILTQSQYAALAPEKTNSILGRIQENAINGLHSLSDIVWSVDFKNDNWNSFLDKIEVHGKESTQNGSILFEFEIIGTPSKQNLN